MIKQHALEQSMSQRKIKVKSKNYIEANGNRNTSYQNLGDAAQAVLKGKLILTPTLKKKEDLQHLTLHLKKLETKKKNLTQS